MCEKEHLNHTYCFPQQASEQMRLPTNGNKQSLKEFDIHINLMCCKYLVKHQQI